MIAAAFAPEAGHRADVGLQVQRVRQPASAASCYEPHEENPMIGYRGASRYLSEDFARVLRHGVRGAALRARRDGPDQRQGHDPVRPHRRRGRAASSTCSPRTACDAVRTTCRSIMMCELPSNAVIADQFLDHFDGFSIGSNDMTQLTLGLDRDSSLVAAGFDERDPAVKFMLSTAIAACKAPRQVRRHLRPGPQRPPRPRRLAARAGHRVDVAQPRHGGRDLDPTGTTGDDGGTVMGGC